MGRIVELRPSAPGGAPAADAAPLEERSDEELMALVRIGIRPAFHALVVRHSDKLAGFCARLTGDRAGASEIAQEVWLAVWDARARWEPQTTFASYLYTIAFRRSQNHARARRRKDRLFVLEPVAVESAKSTAPTEIDRLLEHERRERAFAALGELPPALREALVLRYGSELSYEEMERVTETKAPTLRVRVHHALAHLRERLSKEPK
jgi:RNA polymerase sigma-70 factor (ECF subfamily)